MPARKAPSVLVIFACLLIQAHGTVLEDRITFADGSQAVYASFPGLPAWTAALHLFTSSAVHVTCDGVKVRARELGRPWGTGRKECRLDWGGGSSEEETDGCTTRLLHGAAAPNPQSHHPRPRRGRRSGCTWPTRRRV